MSFPLRSCPWEVPLLRALRAGVWPHAAASELVEHVAGCRACTETARVSAALRAAASAMATPAVSAGAIWWRAQLRRRRAAVEAATRPLVWSQAAALGALLATLAGGLWWAAGAALGPRRDWGHQLAASLAATSGASLIVAFAAAAVLLAGIAAVFAMRHE